MIPALLLASSISLSTGRSIFSKEVSISTNNKKSFFFYQTCLFLVATIVIFFFDVKFFLNVSRETLVYGLIYGALLLGSQWLYTIALFNGKASVCSMVYSFGFIIPTLCGFIFWNETVTALKVVGICLVIPLIVLISIKKKGDEQKSNLYLIPLILSAICSGGLGVVQKLQQRSQFANERIAFLMIGFSIVFVISLICFLIIKKPAETEWIELKPTLFSLATGICFGIANVVNTVLASMIEANILFPIQNIGVILMVTIIGFIMFKEKPKINEVIAFALGITSIILLVL